MADSGTVAEIWLAESTRSFVAGTPPKLTKAFESNSAPVMTITFPRIARAGEKEWMTGFFARGGGGGNVAKVCVDAVEDVFSAAGFVTGGEKLPPFTLPPEFPPPHPATTEVPNNAVAVRAPVCRNCLRDFSAATGCSIERFDFMESFPPCVNLPSNFNFASNRPIR
ncbi:UNVERIFIED_ORG: hypothetical protein J2W38_000658 [Variovorax paradoxus]|nr:hypothetical protein [Variovorax paradoxus]